MTRRSGRALSKVLILFLSYAWQIPVLGQSPIYWSRVTGITQERTGNGVTINFTGRASVEPPVLHYLPAPDVSCVLVADFTGLIWTGPSQTVTPAAKWIRSIHIGQFQDNPPILRVAVSSNNPELLPRLAFKSTAGMLTIRWSSSAQQVATSQARRNQSGPKIEHRSGQPSPSSSISESQAQSRQADIAATTDSDSHTAHVSSLESKLSVNKKSGGNDYNKWNGALSKLFGRSPTRARADMPDKSVPVIKSAQQVKSPAVPISSHANTSLPTSAARAPEELKLVADKTEANLAFGSSKPAGKVNSASTKTDVKAGAAVVNAHACESAGNVGAGNEKVEKPASESSGVAGPDNKKNAPGDAVAMAPAAKTKPSAPSPKRISEQAARESGPSFETAGGVPEPDNSAGTADERALLSSKASRLVVSGKDPVLVEFQSSKSINYRSFRLHDPERYVVDLPGLSANDFVVPAVEPGNQLRAIRLGKLEEFPCRLIFDLNCPEVDVHDSLDETKHRLTLAIGAAQANGLAKLSKISNGTLVVLDAGHGGSDPGAQRGDVQEKEVTLEITRKLKSILEHCGARVVMTRQDDTSVSLEDRVNLTNTNNPDVFLSVHINSLETNANIHGIETYYQTDQSKDLARFIHQELVGNLEAPDRNVRRAKFYVINHTAVPAVLAEVGFISNKEERAKLISSDYQNQIATALGQGVILYLSQRNQTAGGTINQASGTQTASNQSWKSSGAPPGRSAAELAVTSTARTPQQ